MRVLVTGFMARSADRSHQIDYIDGHDALDGLITSLGHEVERRSVVPGEDLSKYDRVIVFAAQIGGLGSTRMLGGLWALGSRPDAILAVDDWRCYLIRKQSKARYVVGKIERLGKHYQGYDVYQSNARVRSVILKTADIISDENKQALPWSVMAPCMPNAQTNQLRLPTLRKFHHFYYASWYEGKYGECQVERKDKKKQWVVAALSKESHEWALELANKEGLYWPILHIGHKDYGPKMEEKDVFHAYCQSLGVISPGYPSIAMSGWYRARFQLAADAETIVVGDPREMSTIYGSFISARGVEVAVACGGKLATTVAEQQRALQLRTPGKRDLAMTVQRMLENP